MRTRGDLEPRLVLVAVKGRLPGQERNRVGGHSQPRGSHGLFGEVGQWLAQLPTDHERDRDNLSPLYENLGFVWKLREDARPRRGLFV